MKLVNPLYHIGFFTSLLPNKETYHTIKTENIFFYSCKGDNSIYLRSYHQRG